MQLETWLAFSSVALVATLTPGPAILLVTTHSLQFGVSRSLATIAGMGAVGQGQPTRAAIGTQRAAPAGRSLDGRLEGLAGGAVGGAQDVLDERLEVDRLALLAEVDAILPSHVRGHA